jgi:hypothetical protein
MCSAISLQPQLGHFLSRHSRPEYFPTWTLVLQKPVCCLDLHILYMSDLDVMARSRCSQSTSLNQLRLLFCVSNKALAYFLTCMEPDGMGYITGDLVPPDYNDYVFLW